jgi:dolichol-phosphate mannosyltransferase
MLFIVLPAYNEGPALEKLLPDMIKELHGTEYRIIVVDDGSKDNTAEVARKFRAQNVALLQHPQNQGLPEALRSGLLLAAETSDESDIIITLDSDNTHPAALIPLMVDKINRGFDLVVASRFVEGGREVGLPWYRKFLSRGAGWTIKLFFNIPGVRDYSCGFRAYRASFLNRGFEYYGGSLIESAGFAVSVELLLKLSYLTPKCVEVPLVLRYDLKCGKSKLPFLKTMMGYFSLIYKLKFKRKDSCEAEVEA